MTALPDPTPKKIKNRGGGWRVREMVHDMSAQRLQMRIRTQHT